MNLGQYIATSVPSLNAFCENSSNLSGISALKALSSVMFFLQRYEFKANHEEWVKSVKPKLGPLIRDRVLSAISTTPENIKALYKVRTEMRAALQTILKDDGILVLPTVADPPFKVNYKKSQHSEFNDRACTLLSIASLSACCQVTIPLGKHENFPISVSFIAFYGSDKFLLDTVLDMYSSLQEQISLVTNMPLSPDISGNMDASELLKEKGNAAFKGKQYSKAVKFYTEAIMLNESNATYLSNRAAAYLELGCFQQAEEDCSTAISLDKKNVKAYMRRGAAKESRLFFKEALKDFEHARVLEPQNKFADAAIKRLRKLISRSKQN
jgi:tetratricopeptide (TPR) repeat protein